MTKPTAFEKTRRVDEVRSLLLGGLTSGAIVRSLSEKYEVTGRTIENYISEAQRGLKADLDVMRPYATAEHIAHRRNLRRRFMANKDYYGELKAAQDEAKLLGLYEETYRVKTWQDEIIPLIRDGRLPYTAVQSELGDELATELFDAAGVPASESGKAQA